jgi:hydrogenase maturation protein HypF
MEGRRITIRGTVQGVGFRPWVYRVAHEEGIAGRVRNDPRGVTIDAFGNDDALGRFVARLQAGAPAPAAIRELHARAIPGETVDDFVIEASGLSGQRALSIPPDLATCPACEADVLDPDNRRHGYPFTNCTHCGPRYTISTDVPYDRPATTMAVFEMCDDCRREYESVADRRFHAQPNACPVCGPRLWLTGPAVESMPGADPIVEAAALLRGGAIVAIKGLGGFHLACDAARDDVVSILRERKHRYQKPLAVMVRDLERAEALAELGPEESSLLSSPQRPIVLVRRRSGAPVAPQVAPDTDLVGLMLPYTPLHHLLMEAVGRPLVMTSGNMSSEPICRTNREALGRLGDIADAFLLHDRGIAGRCDDSVASVIAGAPTLMRRSRGFVPRPIPLARPVAAPVLAFGAHLKNTFCLATGDLAYLGPHVGDLETLEAVEFLEESIERMCSLLDVRPEVVAHDLHPDYLSTRLARSRAEPIKIGVQHHHAHVVSAMAEHRLTTPVIGVAFDGTGHGTDGTSWGGEIMRADIDGFERLGTFRPIPLAGGDTAIREIWRIAVALLDDAFEGDPPRQSLALVEAPRGAMAVVREMIAAGLNSPLARGVGRYFDGAGAIGLGRSRSAFEGQVAVAWDRAAADGPASPYPYDIDRTRDIPEIDLRPMVRALVTDRLARVPAAELSARFHSTLISATAALVTPTPALPVVLTGGCFHNARLATGLITALHGREVYLHHEVPPGDGGIALGQALIADATARRSM